jgi:transglutaminase/protease-like cytokinesis protein 3
MIELILFGMQMMMSLELEQPRVLQPPILNDDVLNNSLNIIKEIAINVSDSNVYVLNRYDCTQFSKELVKRLNKEGFKANCVAGLYLDGDKRIKHTWVEVKLLNQTYPIEATLGMFIDNETYVKDYRKSSNGVCW